jgi:hypothetical protein
MREKRVLLLVGSPKSKRSTSLSLGEQVAKNLTESQGCVIESMQVLKTIRENPDELIQAWNRADAILLAYPVYVDSLPAHVIQTLMTCHENRDDTKTRDFGVMVNCGFPEPLHNRHSIQICREFARVSGLNWRGALSVGGGGTISGKPLAEMGKMASFLVEKSKNFAERFFNTEQEGSTETIEVQLAPTRLYMILGNRNWVQHAKKLGTHKRLKDKPYCKSH